METVLDLKERSEVLFYFGAAQLLLACIYLIFSRFSNLEVGHVNAWHKPIKFAISIGVLSWTMAWFQGYLQATADIKLVNWLFILSLAFEIIYISIQAARGEASHFNTSTPFHSIMYNLMALGAALATVAVGYIGLQFFTGNFPALPDYYLWAIRMGIILFVIFSFEGMLMGSRLSHSVGGADGGKGLLFLNWSRTHGDLRVAHFIGMHALQLLPLLAWYLLKDLRLILIVSALYALLAIYVLVQALQAKPFLRFII